MENSLSISTMKWYLKSDEPHYRRAVSDHLEMLTGKIEIFPIGIAREMLNVADEYLKIKAIRMLPDGHFKIPHLWPGQNPPARGQQNRG